MPERELSTVEVRLYSMFSRDNVWLQQHLATPIMNYCFRSKHKGVICIDRQSVETIIQQPKITYGAPRIFISEQDRAWVEHFGRDIQVIAAACIHNDDSFIALRITNPPAHIDNYMNGTISYIQGHVESDEDMMRIIKDESREPILNDLVAKCRKDMKREIIEEVGFDEQVFAHTFFFDMDIALNHANCYPIYINHPGSTGRHICMLFDVDMSRSNNYTNLVQYLRSNEPEHHEVALIKYEDLCKLPRVDMICPWVAESFSRLPFMSSTFIQGYIDQL